MAAPIRCVAFAAAALALAGCCTSPSGCYVADPAIPMAWDGQGARPGDGNGEPRYTSASRAARSRTGITVGPVEDTSGQAALSASKPATERPSSGKSQPLDKAQLDKQWADQQAADQAADARLSKQLQICRNCQPSAGN
jgi:hypothetical protein